MAAATMTPSRQPLALLDTSRLRSLTQSRANLQAKPTPVAGKRKPLGDIDIAVDSENLNPIFNTPTKRKRSVSDDHDEENESSKKAATPTSTKPRFALKTVNATTATPAKPPRMSAPLSAPAAKSLPSLKPAGRSPTSNKPKTCNPFWRRSHISKAKPAEIGTKKNVTRPFSLAAALSDKSKSKSFTTTTTPKATRAPTATPTPPTPTPKPASWFFDIHVDTKEEEMTNLMQHSTGVLDISDDEEKQPSSSSNRGKENVPPAELGITVAPATTQRESPAAAARKDVMVEESRSPLGELKVADYYGGNCHAFSYAVVCDDDEYDENDEGGEVEMKKFSPSLSTRPTHRSKLSNVSSIDSVLESTAPSSSKNEKMESEEAGIEIWESESAAGEAAEAKSA